MSTRTLIAIPLLLLLSTPLFSAEWNMVVNGKAYHMNAEKPWNEDNWGFGLEREFTTQTRQWVPFAVVNSFRDSINGQSYMTGGGLKRRFSPEGALGNWYFDVGVVGFVMQRDDVKGGRPFLGALPALTIGTNQLALNLTYLPSSAVDMMTEANKVDPTMTGILFLQLKIDLGYVLPVRP